MLEVENLVAVIGMPRSGTTLLTRMLSAHVRIAAIYEPWHQNRHRRFDETNIEALCELSGIQPTAKESLLIKETTSRAANVELLSRTIDTHRTRFRTAFIVILRSPIEALIAYSTATRELWLKSAPVELTEENIVKLMERNARLLVHVFKSLAFYDARIITYGQLLSFPELILKDLTALFGYRYAPTQLRYYRNMQRNQGGDREAFNNPKPVDPKRMGKYEKAVTDLRGNHASLPVVRLASQAHDKINTLASTSIPLYANSQTTQDLLRTFERMEGC